MGKKNKGGNNNQKPAGNSITGSSHLDPAAIGKNGKGFGETVGEAALTGFVMAVSAGVMYGTKALFCKLFGIPFGAQAAALPAGTPAPSSVSDDQIREYINMNVNDDTTPADIKSIIETVIQFNPELAGDKARVGALAAEIVKGKK